MLYLCKYVWFGLALVVHVWVCMVWVGVGCTCVGMYGLSWRWLYMCEYVWFGLALVVHVWVCMVWVGVGCTCVSMYGLGWRWLYMCEYVWFGLALLTIFVLTVSHITKCTNYSLLSGVTRFMSDFIKYLPHKDNINTFTHANTCTHDIKVNITIGLRTKELTTEINITCISLIELYLCHTLYVFINW